MDAHKLAIFGIWLSIGAILLTIPMTIVGNYFTPKFLDWYSTRSRKKLRKRILKLEARLLVSNQEWTYSPAEWGIYSAAHKRDSRNSVIVHFHYIVSASILLLLAFVAIVAVANLPPKLLADVQLHVHIPRGEKVSLLIFLFAIPAVQTGSMVLEYLQFRDYARQWEMHTEAGREELRERIYFLRQKEMGNI